MAGREQKWGLNRWGEEEEVWRKRRLKGQEGGEDMTSSPEVGHQAKLWGEAAAQQNPVQYG